MVLGTVVANLSLVFVSAWSFAGVQSQGASFNEVMAVIEREPDSSELGSFARDAVSDMELYQGGKMPTYPLGLNPVSLYRASVRTVSEDVDYHPYFKKLVHSNGICLSGVWEITEESPYSGYFAQGAKGLFIGRVSTGNNEVVAAGGRAFGIGGKIFPTLDRNEIVRTANFFVIDDLNGTKAPHFLDVAMTNEPPFHFSGFAGKALWAIQKIFGSADKNPGHRPVYPIAEIGLQSGESSRSPQWMKIEPSAGFRNALVNDADFRDEISTRNYPRGLRFDISVSDVTKDATSSRWMKLGTIQTDTALVSFGCDRRLHFVHPKTR